VVQDKKSDLSSLSFEVVAVAFEVVAAEGGADGCFEGLLDSAAGAAVAEVAGCGFDGLGLANSNRPQNRPRGSQCQDLFTVGVAVGAT